MSDEQFFCEHCGHYSTRMDRCTNCGGEIRDFLLNPPGFRAPQEGKLTVRFYDQARAPEAWKALAELWDRLERETSLKIWPSQMEKFPPTGESLELYATDLEMLEIKRHLPGMFTLEFQPLPPDQIPKYPRPPRPEYIPWSKRKKL